MDNGIKAGLIMLAGCIGTYTIGRFQGGIEAGVSLDKQGVPWKKIVIPFIPMTNGKLAALHISKK